MITNDTHTENKDVLNLKVTHTIFGPQLAYSLYIQNIYLLLESIGLITSVFAECLLV